MPGGGDIIRSRSPSRDPGIPSPPTFWEASLAREDEMRLRCIVALTARARWTMGGSEGPRQTRTASPLGVQGPWISDHQIRLTERTGHYSTVLSANGQTNGPNSWSHGQAPAEGPGWHPCRLPASARQTCPKGPADQDGHQGISSLPICAAYRARRDLLPSRDHHACPGPASSTWSATPLSTMGCR